MSRIHEALKKAVEERVSHLSVGESLNLAAIAGSMQAPAVPARQVAEQPARVTPPPPSEAGAFLRFDDLVKLKRISGLHVGWALRLTNSTKPRNATASDGFG